MKHYGNVNKINGAEVEPVDIITFGSPCQDLSVAGKRAGIQDGERSNLFFGAIRIIKEMREVTNDEYPNRELESMGYLTIRGKIERTCLEKRYGLNTDWTNPP